MDYQTLKPGDTGYPQRLIQRLGAQVPVLYSHGPLALLDRFTLAVAASDLIPGRAMLATNQLLFTIRDYGINYIGGWHSVMETEIFRLALYRRNDPRCIRSLTLFSARGLEHEDWKRFLADRFGERGPFTGFPEKAEYLRCAVNDQLLILSITEPSLKKMTRANILGRNFTACAVADAVFIPFAEKGSKTYRLCKQVLAKGIPIFTTGCEENQALFELGIQGFQRNNVGEFLEILGATIHATPAFPQPVEPVRVTLVAPDAAPAKPAVSGQAELFAKQ